MPSMAVIVWCAIGGALGWFGGRLGGDSRWVTRIESVLVGMFGGVIGGEVLAPWLLPTPGAGASGLSGPAVGLALAGGVVALFLLRTMRKAVGPLKAGKPRRKSG